MHIISEYNCAYMKPDELPSLTCYSIHVRLKLVFTLMKTVQPSLLSYICGCMILLEI